MTLNRERWITANHEVAHGIAAAHLLGKTALIRLSVGGGGAVVQDANPAGTCWRTGRSG